MATRNPHSLVEELFQAADHDTATEVGAQPGTIVRTARPREGLTRPKIAWTALSNWPSDLESALQELETLRVNSAADRAILMVDAKPPDGQPGALRHGVLDVMTIRRFAFELANVDEHLAEIRTSFQERFGAEFLPRMVESEDGTELNAVDTIVRWCELATPEHLLWIIGAEGSGRSTILFAAAAEIATRFQAAPDATRPVLSLSTYRRRRLARLLRDEGLVILGDTRNEEWESPLEVWSDWTGRILKRATLRKGDLPAEARAASSVLRLTEPRPRDVAAWLGVRVPSRAAALQRLVTSLPDFGYLLIPPRGLQEWIHVLSAAWPGDAVSDVELAARLVTALLTFDEADLHQDPIIEWALEDFAIGSCSMLAAPEERGSGALDHLGQNLGWFPIQRSRFRLSIVRDYFLAHKIIADVRAGRREILARHQFPREFVLLFLAILSPEVAALASEDRSRAMHDEIAAEIEREVQLALTHNLKHPIARIRGALTDVRRKLAPPERGRITDELAQIEEATRHIAALVEKTSQWSQIPDEPAEELSLALAIGRVLEPLRREWPDVQVSVEVSEEPCVHVGPITLQTILSNLLENAFQAVDANGPERSIAVRVLRTGETLRVEVIDTGPGVHEDDRERIFRPRVTTKKGGRGKPRGTGMGLPIARKYAEHIGGRVWLNPETSQTTFVLELVPAREVPHDR